MPTIKESSAKTKCEAVKNVKTGAELTTNVLFDTKRTCTYTAKQESRKPRNYNLHMPKDK